MKVEIDKVHDALIVVDMQYDFLPGGPLPVKEGDKIIPQINRIIPRFDTVVFTRDWHPEGHVSFSKDPQFVDKSWPPHCLMDTPGAQIHRDLRIPAGALIINKGNHKEKEAYSGFQDTELAEKLRQKGISRVFICGIATDYCVKNTTLGALSNGFNTLLFEDVVRGIDVPPGTVAQALEEMRAGGAKMIKSDNLT